MKKWIDYLNYRKSFYIISFLIIGIYNFVFYLYDVYNGACLYASLLACVVILVYCLFDFYQFYQKSKQLDYMLDLDYIYTSDLSLPKNKIEKQYQELLLKIDNLHKSLENQNSQDYEDMINYFTLWVHQIKTPISALRLLIQSEETTSNDLYMQILKIEQYVDMVMHYMKMYQMSSDLSLKYYSLSSIINDVIKKQASFFIYKKIKLQLDPIDLEVLTDEKWLSFVIEQILSNALKYTKKGSIYIYVKDETLYIEDTGIGIKKEDLPRLFEKGFTGYNGRLDKKASGLGLYLCYQIIKNLGYKINIQSTLGIGTCVAIDLHVDNLNVE